MLEFAAVAVAISLVAVLLLSSLHDQYTNKPRPAQQVTTGKRDKNQNPVISAAEDVYSEIATLEGFDWRTTEPATVFKLKPKYHLTMALENLELSDLLAMDRTYLDRVQLRRDIIAQNTETTVQCNPVAEQAVLELYHWLNAVYLPQRFPTIYALSRDGTALCNGATHERIPLQPTSGLDALKLLGVNIDTDFLILLPSSTGEDGSPVYHLEAFVTCFPSGFDTSKKLGLPLADIHAPVPEYASKIGRSMDRFFARLEVGKAVKRSNWTITTDDVLFRLANTHVYARSTAEADAQIHKRRESVVPERCRLRSERQTLHRLPQTKALVFAFKTYLYRLDELRRDRVVAEQLAQAIEGLGEGNVPAFKVYKSGIIWGDRVVEYLRKE